MVNVWFHPWSSLRAVNALLLPMMFRIAHMQDLNILVVLLEQVFVMRALVIFGYDLPELSGSSQHIPVCQNLLSVMELVILSVV